MTPFPTEQVKALLDQLLSNPPKSDVTRELRKVEQERGYRKGALTRAKPVRVSREHSRTITVLARSNPYRPGTKAAATFALMQRSSTVGAFLALVAENPPLYDAGYLRYASRDGYIALSPES